MWIALVLLLVSFHFLYRQYARLSRPPAIFAVSNDDDQEDRLPNLNGAAKSPGPQTPHKFWDSSDDDSDYQENGLSDITGSTNTPRPQTPYVHSKWSVDGSDDQDPNLNGYTETLVPQTPHRDYISDAQKILFFELDSPKTTNQGDIALSEIVPSPDEAIDLNNGTMLITSLSNTENSNRTIEFRISPLRGKQDLILLYTADGVLAVRISTTRLEESQASIEDTITRLVSLAESTIPIPRAISWLQAQCELHQAQKAPVRVCFIMANNGAAAVIRGSRIPNGIPRNTYTVLSGRFCSVGYAFEKYFELKGEELRNTGLTVYETGQLKGEKYNFNGEREMLVTCPRPAQSIEGGIFVRREDGVGWNQDVTLW